MMDALNKIWNGLNPRLETNLILHLVANLSLFQQPIACDKSNVIGNNGNLVIMVFLMDEVWIFEEEVILIV
jgi:hypothetical protein